MEYLLEVCDLPEQKISEVIKAHIILDEHEMIWELDFYSEIKNSITNVWEDTYTKSTRRVLRRSIVSIGNYWSPEDKLWSSTIYLIDGKSIESLFFTEKKASDFVDVVWNWVKLAHS